MNKNIVEKLQAEFDRRELTIDVEAQVGERINQNGYTVQYILREDHDGEYVNVFIYHRMADGTCIRIRDDGSVHHLATTKPMHLRLSEDLVMTEFIEQQYYAYNQMVHQRMISYGFTD